MCTFRKRTGCDERSLGTHMFLIALGATDGQHETAADWPQTGIKECEKSMPDQPRTMTTHMTGTCEESLAARLELLEAEKELTRRSGEPGAAAAGSVVGSGR
jgi:hypothetical protein